MSRRARITALAIVALVAAGCGSTRFVVVDDQPRRQDAGAAGPATTATQAPPTGPTSAADEADIRKVLERALTPTPRPFGERLEDIDGGEDLEPTYKAVIDLVKDIDTVVTVDTVTVAGDAANATVTVTLGGTPFASELPIELVRIDGRWKVTRAGACAVLSLGSPCPDAPAS